MGGTEWTDALDEVISGNRRGKTITEDSMFWFWKVYPRAKMDSQRLFAHPLSKLLLGKNNNWYILKWAIQIHPHIYWVSFDLLPHTFNVGITLPFCDEISSLVLCYHGYIIPAQVPISLVSHTDQATLPPPFASVVSKNTCRGLAKLLQRTVTLLFQDGEEAHFSCDFW